MRRACALFAILNLVIAAGAQAGPLPVANPSFEQDVTGFFTGLTPTGWTYLGGASGGVFRPLNAFNGGSGNYMDPSQFPPTQGAPDQNQVAFVTGGSLSQITSTPSIAGDVYTLNVWAGTQNNIGAASTFSVGLFENNIQFASFSGTAPINTYEPISISGVAPAGGGNIEIRLASTSHQTLFDDVRLSAPEPASIVLAGLGAISLISCGLNRRATRKG
jgi:hypothetical protein